MHLPTCGVRFRALNVHVARFLQHVPDIFLHVREQPADIFPTEAHQEGQIRTNYEGQQQFEPSCYHTHVQVETFHTPTTETENIMHSEDFLCCYTFVCPQEIVEPILC